MNLCWMHRHPPWTWAAAAGLLLLVDQASKSLFPTSLEPGEIMPTTAWLNAVHGYNTGATFSFRCGPILADGRCWFFIALALPVGVPMAAACLARHAGPWIGGWAPSSWPAPAGA